jgi:hypothetical protein
MPPALSVLWSGSVGGSSFFRTGWRAPQSATGRSACAQRLRNHFAAIKQATPAATSPMMAMVSIARRSSCVVRGRAPHPGHSSTPRRTRDRAVPQSGHTFRCCIVSAYRAMRTRGASEAARSRGYRDGQHSHLQPRQWPQDVFSPFSSRTRGGDEKYQANPATVCARRCQESLCRFGARACFSDGYSKSRTWPILSDKARFPMRPPPV